MGVRERKVGLPVSRAQRHCGRAVSQRWRAADPDRINRRNLEWSWLKAGQARQARTQMVARPPLPTLRAPTICQGVEFQSREPGPLARE